MDDQTLLAIVGSVLTAIGVIVGIWAVAKRVKPKLKVQVLSCEHGIRRDGNAFLLRLIFRVHNMGDKNTTLTELETSFRDGQGNPYRKVENLKQDVDAGESTDELKVVYSFTPPFPFLSGSRCDFILRHTHNEYSFFAYSTQSATPIDPRGFFL